MTTRAEEQELDDVDRELLNAVQWDFPLEPRPYAVLGERLGIGEPEVRQRIDRVEARRRVAPTLGDLRHAGARLHLRARRREGRSRSHRRRGRDRQRAPRRQPQLQAQSRLQPLVHDRRPARRVARRAHRRAAPRVRRDADPQAPDVEALQDRREARHDGQDRGRREDRGARARTPGTQSRDARAGSLRPRARSDPRRAGGPPQRRAAVRGAGRFDRDRRANADRHDPLAQGAQADAAVRGRHEPSQRGLQGQRDGRVGGARRPARRDRPPDGDASPP